MTQTMAAALQGAINEQAGPQGQKADVIPINRAERRAQAGLAEKHAERKASVAKYVKQKQGQQKKPAATPFPVYHTPVVAGRDVVVIFECHRKEIPDGIQILPMSGGAKAPAPSENDDAKMRFEAVRVDMAAFAKHLAVQSINVRQIPNSAHCRVFINCRAAVDDPANFGFNHWANGPYYALVDRLVFGRMWQKAAVGNGDKTSIVLGKHHKDAKAAAKLLLSFSAS